MKIYAKGGEVYDNVKWLELHEDTNCFIFADNKELYKLELNEFDKAKE